MMDRRRSEDDGGENGRTKRVEKSWSVGVCRRPWPFPVDQGVDEFGRVERSRNTSATVSSVLGQVNHTH